MKRLSLLLVVIFMLGMVASVLRAEEVTIGAGDQNARMPMDYYWKNSLYQCLFFPAELGFASGTISAIKLYNNFTTNSPNGATKIWLGSTTQSDLSAGYIPSTQMTLVFDGNVTYPSGQNTINIQLTTPYTHTPGNLVMMFQRPMDANYYSSTDYFQCQTIGTNRARNAYSDSDSFNPAAPPAGTLSGQFPKTSFTYTGQAIVNDLGCMGITGNLTPTVGIQAAYTISIRNNGSAAQSNYTVKLMKSDNTELGSVAGPAINSQQTLPVIINWTPTTAGPVAVYGKVIMTGDEIAQNNQTQNLNLVVQPAGIQATTIGEGNQDARMPMDFYWKNSLYQCIYYADELGFGSGTITGMQLYNNFTTNSPNGATKIWLGTTAAQDLSAGYIPSTQMTLVFDGNVTYPSGQNNVMISFNTPYMHTPGNLVMMVQRPMDGSYYSSSDYFKCQTIGANRARNAYSDSDSYNPAAPPAGTLTGQFPKTTFFYTGQAIVNDIGCLSITGNTTPSVGAASPYVVTIKNNGTSPQSNYTVKLMKEGGVELASIAGPAISSMQTLTVTLNWTPSATGPTFIYGKVEMAGDEIAQNNQSPNLNVVVQAAGIVAVTVGNGGSTGRIPMDMFYKSSIFETLYLASELNIGGLLTGMQFYNSFTSNLSNLPVKIWVGETTQTDLAAGWIPSTQMTLVFDGTMNFPSGQNNILFNLTTPYPYGGGNMVVMVLRPLDTQYYSSSDNFVTQTGTVTARSRNAYSDSVVYDPAAPPTATPAAMFPKATFMFITQGMGALNGTVYGPGNTPLAGATVTVANSTLTYTTGANGTYSFPYISQGNHQVTATKHGYTSVTQNVSIVESQTTTQNFTIALLPQVTVSGRIVGSDAPTVGIAGATISLSGYEPYSATTNAQGQFTIANVFASQTYQYVANATGYQAATGQAVVGTTNLIMGDITVNEMAFPPFGVVANENDAFTQVNVSWQAPNPNAIDITEGFEDATFPPTDWSQIINNPNTGGAGVQASWCRVGTIALTPPVPPHGGAWQAGMWWDYDAQNEWLITPQFNCPPSAVLNFWSYVYLGSTNGDHYYVKASTDGGNTWTVLWDASALTGEWNYYTTPINISLASLAGQQVKLAFQAIDGDGQGLWYVWFLDDISIGMPTGVMRFPINEFTTRSASESNRGFATNVVPNRPISREMVNNPNLQMPSLQVATPSNTQRTLLGYKVWRFLAANQNNESTWTALTPNNITATNFNDTAWGPLPSGVYKYAVKAVYTNNVMSVPSFSNELHKGMMGVLSGTVTEFGTNIPVAGATITAGEYSGTSNAQGQYSFSVYAGTYNVTCAKPSYQTATQNGVVIVGLQTTTQNFVLTEITLPAGAVHAELAGNNVNITWMAPGPAGGEWIHYDSGENDDSIGTGSAVEFDVAIRYPGSALTDYIGMSLYAVKVWPAQAGTFKVRVWTGGTPTAPGAQVIDQLFTPNLDTYNTVVLSTPVPITGNQELWFGYNCNVTSGYPAGCDAGPALDGFGNMMYFQGAWSTLLQLASSLNYNWNIQGYVGYSAPTAAPMITPISLKSAYPGQHTQEMDRALTGYKVWRLQQGQEGSENAWTSLTTNPISATAYQDSGWGALPDGTYKWAVKAIYTGGAAAPAAFSNAIPKITQIGTIAGIVRNNQNAPVSGATVRCGTVTATTNTSGAYSMQVVAGTHTVTASHPNYSPASQQNVVVVTGQTTTVNFILQPSLTLFEDGFENHPNFAIEFAPWTLVDVDGSATYGITNTTWTNAYAAQAFIIFVPSATTPAVTNADPHGGIKEAACFAATTPPNNDWMITPQLTGVGELKFWARSYTAQYGLEKFKVGVSTTGTAPNNFTIVSGAAAIQAPVEWTEYTYDLTAYAGSPVRIGINCVSNDAFFFLVDDVKVTAITDSDDPAAPVTQTALNANYPNPFNPETTISFSLKEAAPVTLEIYNVKGQLVKTLVKDIKAAGNHSIVWNGTDNLNRSVSSGVYYYKMSAGKYSSTRKMILMK